MGDNPESTKAKKDKKERSHKAQKVIDRMGKKLKSEILLADAEHTRSDIFVSLTVLASLVAVRLGWGWVDAVAALVVVGLIGRAAWRIMRPSVNILVDRAALEENVVTSIVQKIPGVHRVARVRSRGPHDEIYLDLDIEIAAPTTAAHSANIAHENRSWIGVVPEEADASAKHPRTVDGKLVCPGDMGDSQIFCQVLLPHLASDTHQDGGLHSG